MLWRAAKRSYSVIVACFLLSALLVPTQAHVRFHTCQSSPQAPGEHVNRTVVKGTHIRLVKPTGFVDAVNFLGFQQAKTVSTIMVTEMPDPFDATTDGYTSEDAKSRGMTLLSKEDVTIDGHAGLLFHLTQVLHSVEFEKWVVLFGDKANTILITAACPRQYAKTLSQPLRNALLSAEWDKSLSVDPLAGMNFTLKSSPSLKFALRVQSLYMFSRDGNSDHKNIEDPWFSIGYLLSRITALNKKQYCIFSLMKLQLDKPRIDSIKPVTIDGLNGYEIYASGNDPKAGIPLAAYQTVLFDGQSGYMAAGLVGAK